MNPSNEYICESSGQHTAQVKAVAPRLTYLDRPYRLQIADSIRTEEVRNLFF
jgi:hypothetical protein